MPSHVTGGGCPRTLESARDSVVGFATAVAARPPEALLLQAGTLGFWADIPVRVGSAMGFAEGVTSGDESDCFGVVHGHTCERLPDVLGRRERVGFPVRSFGVHVDQAHLHRAEWIGEHSVSAVTLITKPFGFRSPVDVLFGFPHVLTATTEAERLETHRLQRHIPSENHQISP